MRRSATLILAALGLGTGWLAPLAAQDAAPASGERINTIIVYGDDPCPASAGIEITVCARKAEAERFRIPAPLRETPSSKSEAWAQRVLAYETVGREGIQSCSPVGPGGVLGCTQKLINAAYAEKKAATDVNFAKMIEDERAKRAAVTDAEAAATQARVEQAEKDYEARQRAAADPGAVPAKP
ncbi:hypothetical protein ACFOON_04385 [Novosphingobium piscinae]|uniref:Uncharacterized protein n=1 Tax=Novosphingobium piscinae TaxID=1507448 RepID=A0A7X1G1F3_9SPHN|nr:hypothetical protein [Novosphingobium piscinae]MBC2670801.1 hypothetical protein [Novosphingobium piscinae]